MQLTEPALVDILPDDRPFNAEQASGVTLERCIFARLDIEAGLLKATFIRKVTRPPVEEGLKTGYE